MMRSCSEGTWSKSLDSRGRMQRLLDEINVVIKSIGVTRSTIGTFNPSLTPRNFSELTEGEWDRFSERRLVSIRDSLKCFTPATEQRAA